MTHRRALLSNDTSPEAERAQILVWRSLSTVELAQLVAGASRAARTLALAGIHERHPEASDAELVQRYAILTVGRSLARRVYPDVDRLTDAGS